MATPVVPEGFTLDSENIPEGFVLDEPDQTTGDLAKGSMQSLLKGATLGFSDEIQSVIAAAVASPFVSDKDFGQLMIDARTSFREEDAEFKEKNPVLSTGLEIAGGVGTGVAGLVKATGLGSAALIGGAEGAIAGAGLADEDELFSKETAVSTAIGTGVGVTAGVALPILAGIAVKGAKSLIGKAKDLFTPKSEIKQKIIDQIDLGEGIETKFGKYLINGAGKIKNDPSGLFAKSIRQGFDPGSLAMLRGATATDRSKVLRMVDIIERGKGNKRFAALNRSGDVVGDTLLDSVKYLKSVNKKAGRDINRIAKKELKGKDVDLSEPTREFAEALDSFGIKITNENGVIKVNFDELTLAPGDRGPTKEIIRQMARLQKQGPIDAAKAHEMKKIIDRNVTFGKDVPGGLGGDAERVLRNFRSGIDDALDSAFPNYNKANTTYSDTIRALDALQDAAGRKLDLAGPSADKALGKKLRSLLSNNLGRENMFDAVVEISEISRKYGATFDDDIVTQVIWANELEEIFKTAPATGFKGQITRAAKEAEKGRTAVGTAVDIAQSVEDVAFGKSEQEAFDVIKLFLKEN